MSESYLSSLDLPRLPLWKKAGIRNTLIAFDLEVTARCNQDCRHCYVNVPADDTTAKGRELGLHDIQEIVREAISLGALWCLVTGGEPLLREDFLDLYVYLKSKGLLVSVFTNATLLTREHANLFRRYPPRDIEVTVYGTTRETYERVTRTPGSFDAFQRGLNLLLENGVKVRLKAMALRSNIREFPEIAGYCRKRTKDYFRFDPFLHLRFDRDQDRNAEIRSERLSSGEIVSMEKGDRARFRSLERSCDKLIPPRPAESGRTHLFGCGAGQHSFTVGPEGFFRLCSSLHHPACTYDLKKGTLTEACRNFVPRVRELVSERDDFVKKCRRCPIINLCLWCPAHAHLETGELDSPVEYFCAVAHARAGVLSRNFSPSPERRPPDESRGRS